MLAPLLLLHFSQSSSIFLAVLLPPLERGIIWSYSRFSRLSHLVHLPLSRRHTSTRTCSGTRIRDRVLSCPAGSCLCFSFSMNLLSLSNSSIISSLNCS